MLDIKKREIERYLGYKGIRSADPGVGRLIDACVRDIQAEVTPRYVCQTFPIEWYGEEETVGCGFAGIRVASRSLLRNLKDCTEVVMMAATIGPGPDRLIRKAEVRNMLTACVLQAVGAAAAEAWCDEVNGRIREEARERGLYTRPRFSPGYGDFPLEVQRDFEQVLKMQKRIGVSLTDSLLMTPTKSVTAVIGLSPKKKECVTAGCGECSLAGTCEYSRKDAEQEGT